MIPLTLAQLADVVGGELDAASDGARQVTSVAIDSREAQHGSVFVALPGERVDGHDYIDAAMDAGATGYLHREGFVSDLPGGISVDDPADALLGLGLWIREEVAPTVVAITGSNGKTTTKDLIAAAVGAGRSVVATAGSQNNELGLPLTCCRLERGTEVLVAEIGMRGEGQIAELAVPLRPDIAVVTNVAGVHLELLGDLDAVARAKAELVHALAPAGVAVLNADDPRVARMGEGRAVQVVTYGVTERADVHATGVRLDAGARARFTIHSRGTSHEAHLSVPGAHNVSNALAAFAVAQECGVPPEVAVTGLELATVSPWRMQLETTDAGVRILNDAYNANPDSTTAALRTLAAVEIPDAAEARGTAEEAADQHSGGRRIAVLGYMAEIGPTADAEHARIGRLAAQLELDGLLVVGESARGLAQGAAEAEFAGALGIAHVSSADEAVTWLADRSREADVVLVKASRSAGLERVAAGLLDAHALAEQHRPGGQNRSGGRTGREGSTE